jgi:hypothetical protein
VVGQTTHASQEVVLVGVCRGCRAVGDTEFGIDVLDVAGDRVRADHQFLGDFAVGPAGSQVDQRFLFAG